MAANGNALQAHIEATQAALDGLSALDYYRQPMPSQTDAELFDVVRWYRQAGPAHRAAFDNHLTPPQRAFFGLFAHRAATLAVRLNTVEWLEIAFLASILANQDVPASRNIDLQLAVLHHCARKLEQSPLSLFDWAATFAEAPLSAHYEQFGRRDDISLKQYGWVERRTPDGVAYTYKWR